MLRLIIFSPDDKEKEILQQCCKSNLLVQKGKTIQPVPEISDVLELKYLLKIERQRETCSKRATR